MELVKYYVNCLGTVSFVAKFGKMKKAEEFTTYPMQSKDDTKTIYLQSSHRWAEMNAETGAVVISARRAQYANSMFLMLCKMNGTAETDNATPAQLAEMLTAIRATASPHAGGNNILSMYCDNSAAALV